MAHICVSLAGAGQSEGEHVDVTVHEVTLCKPDELLPELHRSSPVHGSKVSQVLPPSRELGCTPQPVHSPDPPVLCHDPDSSTSTSVGRASACPASLEAIDRPAASVGSLNCLHSSPALPTRSARKSPSSSRTSRKQPVVHVAQVHFAGQLKCRYLRRRRRGQLWGNLHHRVVEPHLRL